MSLNQRSVVSLGLSICLLASVTGCTNSSVGEALQQSLAADPRLEENPNIFSQVNSPPAKAVAKLPADFPLEIPLYPNAVLQEVVQSDSQAPATEVMTQWSSTDPGYQVQSFYKRELETNGWQILSQPTDDRQGTFVARRQNLQVTITLQNSAGANQPGGSAVVSPIPAQPGTTPPNQPAVSNSQPVSTVFSIQYAAVDNSNGPLPSAGAAISQSSGSSFRGSVQPSTNPNPSTASSTAPSKPTFTDLDKVPLELRQSVKDLAELGVLPLQPTQLKTNQTKLNQAFQPNQTITRREYARWLVTANNQFHANRSAQQIRLGLESTQPIFRDVPRNDPDFAVIQGLAETGLIPSPLSGDTTTVTFRPDAPLTRETLLLWKVPLDTRQALPTATIDAVKQTWGFQDAARIEPKALRAVLADFQNGDLATIRRVFGYTTLFQPKKTVTRAEAAASLWYFGVTGEGVSAQEVLKTAGQVTQTQ